MIKMNDIEYQIIEMSQKDYKEFRKKEDEDTGCEITDTTQGVWYGASHHYQNTIVIDKDLKKDRKRRVLIHELTHCYISEYITHQEQQYTEEDVADISANSHDIIHKIVEDYFNKTELTLSVEINPDAIKKRLGKKNE